MSNVVVSGIGFVGRFVYSRLQAKEVYESNYAWVMNTLAAKGPQSADGKAALELLESTATVGAKRLNFRRYYIDRGNWKRLPPDPRNIPYGHW